MRGAEARPAPTGAGCSGVHAREQAVPAGGDQPDPRVAAGQRDRDVDHGEPGADQQHPVASADAVQRARQPRVGDVALPGEPGRGVGAGGGLPSARTTAVGGLGPATAERHLGPARLSRRRPAPPRRGRGSPGARASRAARPAGRPGSARTCAAAGRSPGRADAVVGAPAQQVVGVVGEGAQPGGGVVHQVVRVGRAVREPGPDRVGALDRPVPPPGAPASPGAAGARPPARRRHPRRRRRPGRPPGGPAPGQRASRLDRHSFLPQMIN